MVPYEAAFSISESIVDSSHEQLKSLPRPTGILKYPDRQTGDLWRLLTVERESTCLLALFLYNL